MGSRIVFLLLIFQYNHELPLPVSGLAPTTISVVNLRWLWDVTVIAESTYLELYSSHAGLCTHVAPGTGSRVGVVVPSSMMQGCVAVGLSG